jgi:hypothetical protein
MWLRTVDRSVSSEPQPPFWGEGGNDSERSQIVGDPRHRWLLSILLGRSRPIGVEDLCARLASEEAAESSSSSVSDRRSIRLDLRHRCLPKLEAIGWIDRRPEGLVADEPINLGADAFSPPDLRNPDDPDWGATSVLLGSPRREAIVSVVAARQGRIGVDGLVRELRAPDRVSPGTVPDDDRTVSITLHHVDLPRLAAADLIEHDRDGGTVVRTDRLVGFAARTDLDTP